MLRCRITPRLLHEFPDLDQMRRDVQLTVLANRRECRDWPNALRPERAADKTILSRLHYIASADDCRHRIAVSDRFSKHGEVRRHTVDQMHAACVQAPA